MTEGHLGRCKGSMQDQGGDEHNACVPSRVQLSATPWTVACKFPLSIGLSRQEHWSELPFPPPGDRPDPGVKPMFNLKSPALAHRFFTTSATWDEHKMGMKWGRGQRRHLSRMLTEISCEATAWDNAHPEDLSNVPCAVSHTGASCPWPRGFTSESRFLYL